MKSQAPSEQDNSSEVIANRYRVLKLLGQGGMAEVYEVLDTSTQNQLALKRMRPRNDEEKQSEIARFFEQEYYTLVQLAHPRVVEVFDYGIDDANCYYTMELLDGGDLRELSPLPWQKACSLLHDVCSSLSLLHSRRLVHRDLTPRNVRCTRDEKAKLIDFGAMVPMGPCKAVVGTPPFTAPEVVMLQALDARTDLFSLGATAYYILTGRNAFPARDFNQLHDLWRGRPAPPSRYVDGIPGELDNIVLSLINIDPTARPVNAAEVMEKLSAVAGLETDEQLRVSQAYLSTATLVGRDEQLLRVRKKVLRALRSRGNSVVIQGASGVGRSRFLDACVLEGKLAGAIVLKADASDGRTGNWGVVRTLAFQLLDALPAIALQTVKPHVPVLGHILPELLALEGSEAGTDASRDDDGGRTPKAVQTLEAFDDPQLLRPRVQAALRDWWLDISARRCVVVAVDDIQQIDEPSAAFVALLAHELSAKMLLVAVSVKTDTVGAASGAVKLLREASSSIKLRNLELKDTERLLYSIFGEVPNVRLLSDRLYKISQGNPQAVMQLAQHLVDKGLVSYRTGAWSLPDSIDAADLPGSLTEALKARIRELSEDAQQLVQTLALSPKQSFSFSECLELTEHRDKARLIRNFEELVAATTVTSQGQQYALGQQGWVAALTDDLDQRSERAFHLKLAEVFEKRGTYRILACRHLLRAGEQERALDTLLETDKANRVRLMQSPEAYAEYVNSLPTGWIELYESALKLCQKLDRPRRQGFAVQLGLVSLGLVAGTVDRSHLAAIIEQLRRDSGLGVYQELGDSVETSARLGRALELTQQRFDSCPEKDRAMAPVEAIPTLATMAGMATGFAIISWDHSLIEILPSLGPLVPLSPALGVIDKLIQTVGDLTAARYEQTYPGYEEILERTGQPDRAGLEETVQRYTRLGCFMGLGMIEANKGLESCMKWADAIEQDPLYQVNAWRVRMVYYLRQGDTKKVEQIRKRVELLQIQNSPVQFFEGTQLLWEVCVYSLSDSLMGVKQTTSGIEKMADLFASWVPVLHFARGEYQRIRGDYVSARDELEQALNLIAPGRHPVWAYTAAAHLRTLLALDCWKEARTIGQKYLQAAEKEDLRTDSNYIRLPLALIEASLDEHEDAVKHATAAIDWLTTQGTTGLDLGLAYETRARVAMLMNDHECFKTYAKLCADQYQAGHNPALTAKYEKLVGEALQAELGIPADLAHAADDWDREETFIADRVTSILTLCNGPQERAQRSLDILIKHSNSSGGFLYTVQKNGPVLSAQKGTSTPPVDMDTMVRNYIAEETEEADEVTMVSTGTDSSNKGTYDWSGQQGEQYRPVLLGHYTKRGFALTGLAILCIKSEESYRFPSEVVVAVSNTLLNAGDVATMY